MRLDEREKDYTYVRFLDGYACYFVGDVVKCEVRQREPHRVQVTLRHPRNGHETILWSDLGGYFEEVNPMEVLALVADGARLR